MSVKPCQLCKRMFDKFPWTPFDTVGALICAECRAETEANAPYFGALSYPWPKEQKEQTMLVCDSCEGREDVKRIAARIVLIPDQPEHCDVTVATEAGDLCLQCRNRVARTIKEAVGPQPRGVTARRALSG